MKIKILRNYGGTRTRERRILPGVYEAGDSALFGLEDYLLEIGEAQVVDDTVDLVQENSAAPQEDHTFHNELMRAKGRPEIDVPIPPAPQETLDELAEMGSVDNVVRLSLEIDYERAYGRKPPSNISDETLRERVAEATSPEESPSDDE